MTNPSQMTNNTRDLCADISSDFLNEYATSARQAAEQAMKSLDTANNWGLTLSLAILGILASMLGSPLLKGGAVTDIERVLLLVIVAAALPMLVHFGIRAAKSYINIVRFAKLEREALKCNLRLEDGSDDALRSAIIKYHLKWKSPIGRFTILKKVVFEFGFSYEILIIMFCFYAASRGLAFAECLAILLLALFVSGAELWNFSVSPYIRDPELDDESQKIS